jgi:lysyl-tRNA synthetase class 2
MASLEEIRQTRLEKLHKIKEAGMDPYPALSKKDADLAKVVVDFAKLEKKAKPLTLVGRVMSLRPQGALTFITFNDGTAPFQALLKRDTVGEKAFSFFSDVVDIGDFIQIKGALFLTKRSEKTIEVKEWTMLSKSLRPLPEKWHGLQDVEERFRKRYLDTLMSEEVKERFIIRSRIITELRKILDDADYLEVETPALQPLYGGASAEPFVTHHNALAMDMYLRISNELYLKRMLVGGFPKIYEIARDFRNEGIDVTHNPEFTMVEFYEAYSDASKQMAFTEKIFKTLVAKVFKKKSIVYGEQEIDFSKKFQIVSYFDLLRRYALIPNPESVTESELALKATQLGITVTKGDSIPKLLDSIYKKTARPKIIQPTFVVDYPVEYLPLAKRNPKNPKFVDAFQLVAGGIELIKAFSELNDPIDQAERFAEQEKNKTQGEADAQRMDTEYIEAMEYGMPPAGGVGIGIDRLVMFLTDTKNIKEVIYFPTMKRKE